MSRNCSVCSSLIIEESQSFSVNLRTTASNVCLMFKLFDLLGHEFFSGVLCQICFELVEQIDCFEQNILGSKERLKTRYLGNSGKKIGRKSKGKKSILYLENEEKIKNIFTNEFENGDEDDENDEDEENDESLEIKRETRESFEENENYEKYNEMDFDEMTDESLGNESEEECNVSSHSVFEGPHRISPLQYDMFKLKCPKAYFPKIISNDYDELTCVFCKTKKSSWTSKIHHYLLSHKDQAPFECPLDNEPLESYQKVLSHVLKAHPHLLDSFSPSSSSFSQMKRNKTKGLSTPFPKFFFLFSKESVSSSFFSLPSPPPPTSSKDENGDKRSICIFCGLICTSELSFLFHIRFHHDFDSFFSESIKPCHSCPFCDIQENDFAELVKHVIGYHFGASTLVFPSGLTRRKKRRRRKTLRDREEERGGGEERRLHCIFYPYQYLSRQHQPPTQAQSSSSNNNSSNDGSGSAFEEIYAQLYSSCLSYSFYSSIINEKESIEWDMTKLKNGMDFEIPGDKTCFVCDITFETWKDKITHRVTSHRADVSSAPYYCTLCPMGFFEENLGASHMTKEHSSTPLCSSVLKNSLTCSLCGLSSDTSLSFALHAFNSHRDKSEGLNTLFRGGEEESCNICSFQGTRGANELKSHILIAHGGYSFECPLCSDLFSSVTSFQNHIVSHQRNQSRRRNQTQNQTSSHFEKKGYVKKDTLSCDLCHHDVRGPRMLSKHMETVHGLKTKVSCSKCFLSFDSYSFLKAHTRDSHTKSNSSFPCSFCGSVFETKDAKETHVSHCHGGEERGGASKDFLCENCSRTFSSKQLLSTHMRIHSDERKISCKICGKSFKWESSLVSHTRAAHMTLLPSFDCTYCGKAFKDKSNLKNHIYTHTGKKPFTCSLCSKGFIRRDLMKSHVESCLRR